MADFRFVTTIKRWEGFSTDAKPAAAAVGDRALETDTEREYTWNGTAWALCHSLAARIGEIADSPTANTVLARLKALVTTIVLAAGTNVIGKVRLVDSGGTEVTEATGHSVQAKLIAGTAIAGQVGIDQTTQGTTNAVRVKSGLIGTPFTGTGAPPGGSIVVATHKIAPAAVFRLLRIEIHLSAAPTTSENFTVTLDAGDGSAYDTVLAKQDLSAGSLTDFAAIFGSGWEFEADDVITAAWTNTDGRTWGLRFVYELI